MTIIHHQFSKTCPNIKEEATSCLFTYTVQQISLLTTGKVVFTKCCIDNHTSQSVKRKEKDSGCDYSVMEEKQRCLIDLQATFDCDTVGELRQHQKIPDPVTYINTHTQNSKNINVPPSTSEEEELLNLDTRELVNIIQSLRRDNRCYKLTLSYFDRTSKDLADNRDAVVTVLHFIDNITATQTSLNNLTVNSRATTARESNIDKDFLQTTK
ncbi:hypothetical protein Pcinc_000287 [Petrolisthes cinctipes]|uniref:Uncharacterized protein n=1 Tax=Petrolisthes cinctipes TaxID=88211 RepID=A0AAE1GMI6_PETCI|nr:hypothetical protein Pcinc_000282 [Petrolisthes cinctipes]KAK3896043.1 hypothetical protein Pcinc_000287 [Petrolisthes cinctipes]